MWAFTRGYSAEDWFDLVMRFFLYVLVFWQPYSMAVIEWAFGLSLATFIVKRVYVFVKSPDKCWTRMFRPVSNPLNRPIAVFLAACFISVFMSDRFQDSFESFFTKTAEPIVLYFLFIEAFRSLKQIRILIMVILITALATAIDAMVQYHISGSDMFLSRPLSKGPRATAGFNAPNGLGAYLVMTIPVIVGYLFARPISTKRSWLWIVTVLGAMSYALILTFSRGAWLSLIFGGIIVAAFFMVARNLSRKQITAFLLLSGILLGLLSTYYVSNKDKFSSLNRSVLTWRLEAWQDTVEMIKEKPLFGYGINTYMRQFQYYRYDRLNIPKHRQHHATYAHNCYLQIAMETGLAGLLAFLWLLIVFYQYVLTRIRDIYHRYRDRGIMAYGIFAGITAFLIHAFFDTHFYSLPLAAYLWSMMAILFCLLNPEEAGRETEYAQS